MRSLALLSGALTLAGALAGRTPVRADDPAPPSPAPAPKAPAQPDSARILAWVADLGSDDFRTRESASKHLAEAGEAAREALEAAAKTSDSLEVRWRAQQLLLRLTGQSEKPLDPSQPATDTPPNQPQPPRVRGFVPGVQGAEEQMRRLIEELMRMHRMPFPSVPGLEDGMDPFRETLTAGEFTLHVPVFGEGVTTLEVRGTDAAGKPTRQTFQGDSLDTILAAHPEFKDRPAIADLKKQVEARRARFGGWQGFAPNPGGGPVVMFRTEGLEVRQDATGATVRVQKQGPDGKTVTEELHGATLDDIKREHPELKDRLDAAGSFRIQFGPPRLFRGPQQDGLEPLPAQPEQPVPGQGEPRFGVSLENVPPVLALHLGLEEGQGVLVADVVPDSQAAKLGLERYDVIESVGGQKVTSREQAVRALRAAAKDGSPLSIGIIRGGKRQTLSR